MVAVRLAEDALAYAVAKLDEADGGLAGAIPAEALWEPVVFVPDFIDPLTLPELDQDAGWGASQEGAASELASFLLFLKKRDGRLRSLILDDPWATPGDLDYDGPPPDELLSLHGRVSYLHDLTMLSPELLLDWRAVAVSHLKIAYLSDLSTDDIRALAEDEPDDVFAILARSIRHIAINAYNDESWLIVRCERSNHHEHAPHNHGRGGDCDCDGDGDCDGDCGEDCSCRHHD